MLNHHPAMKPPARHPTAPAISGAEGAECSPGRKPLATPEKSTELPLQVGFNATPQKNNKICA